MTTNRLGFTLIELLVVVAIVAIVIGLLLPSVQAVRESGRRTTCTNNLRQVALAVLNFESSYKRLPAGITSPSATPYRSLSWLTQILPFADQGPLWDQAREDYAYDPSPYLRRRRKGVRKAL
jgi:prepilin-type N-terminal cleavage/methylation domain-containing protein